MNWDEQHPSYRKELGRRLLSTIDRLKTKQAAADAAGVTVQQMNKWTGAGSDEIPKVPVSALLGLSKAAGVDFLWLATGEAQVEDANVTGARQQDLIDVPRYNVALSAGGGSFIERAERLDSLPFPPEFFTRRLNRKPDGVIIVDARGDSMAPTVADRDLVMIDTADLQMTSAIWGFTYEDGVFIKRINVLPDALEVVSDNPAYKPFIIDRDHTDLFHPIGRVVWVGRTL